MMTGVDVILDHNMTHRELVTFLMEYEARKLGLRVTRLSRHTAVYEDGKHSVVLFGGCAGISHAAHLVTRDKSATKVLFKSANIPCPEYVHVGQRDLDLALQFAEACDYNVVIKASGIFGGLAFFSNISNADNFTSAWYKHHNALNRRSIYHSPKSFGIHDKQTLIEHRFIGHDYRFWVVDRNIVGVVERVPANVIGDGKSNVASLIDRKNLKRSKNPYLRKNPIVADSEMARMLVMREMSFDSVAAEGAQVLLRSNANVSTGGDSIDRTEEIPDPILDLVVTAVASVPQLRSCGVDVLAKDIYDGTKLGQDDLVFCELESNANLGPHHFPSSGKARNVAREILLEHFGGHAPTATEPYYRHDFDDNRTLCEQIIDGIMVYRPPDRTFFDRLSSLWRMVYH